MKVRFLQTTPSGVPGYPFQAGQVIEIDAPSDALRTYLDGVHAEVVRDTEPETAVARAPRKRKAHEQAAT